MPTTRTLRADRTGPVTLVTDLPAQDLTVIAGPGPGPAELTIHTVDDTGPSADAVNAATLHASGDRLEVRVPKTAGGGVTTIVQSGGGHQSVIGSVVGGSVIQVGGGAWINGVRVDAGTHTHVVAGGSPIVVTAQVPEGSHLDAQSISTGIVAAGALDRVDAHSVSGDIRVDTVNSLKARTVSGDIRIAKLVIGADLQTVSGDITVHGGSTARARAQSVSGDVRATGGVDVDARTVSGRVTNR